MTDLNLFRRGRGSGGYAIILAALLLIPLMAAAAVAVDLGARHSAASEIQRAADAAALAGVTALPRGLPAAINEARQVAGRNGYHHGVGGVEVDVRLVPGSGDQLEVRITDPNQDQFFVSPFDANRTISRTSTARYVAAVSLGSPRNYLGTRNLMGQTSHRERFSLAINGQCVPREQGDRIMAIADGTGGGSCTGSSEVNPEYFEHGYFYAVEVPHDFSGDSIRIQIYDGANCVTPSNWSIGTGPPNDLALGATHSTRIRLRTGHANPLAAPVIAGADTTVPGGTKTTSGSGTCSVQSGNTSPGVGSGGVACSGNRWAFCWRSLHSGSLPVVPGQVVYIQIQALQSTTSGQDGVNTFALRVANGSGTFQPCSSDPEDAQVAYSSGCVSVYALTHLGVYADIQGTAEFFLAQIGPEHSGKELELTLWDSGEGAESIELLRPDGVPARFDWEVLCLNNAQAPCVNEATPTGGWGPHLNRSIIDVSGTGIQARTNRISACKYNGRLIRLTTQLPADIDQAFDSRTWWKIRYRTGGTGCNGQATTDRTTWTVQVKGDPVRLMPNVPREDAP